MPKQRMRSSAQSSSRISAPEALIQVRSLTSSSSSYAPVRKRLRRRIGYLCRSAVSFCTNRTSDWPRPSQLPVEPADLVVLAIGVVVALLRARELVARQHHRRALRQQQRCEEVAHLPLAQGVDARIVGRTLGAAVPGAVVASAVLVVLAVRLVVLVVVADDDR